MGFAVKNPYMNPHDGALLEGEGLEELDRAGRARKFAFDAIPVLQRWRERGRDHVQYVVAALTAARRFRASRRAAVLGHSQTAAKALFRRARFRHGADESLGPPRAPALRRALGTESALKP